MRFTFAIVGRDEAATLADVVAMAAEAAGPDDAVWFVDSASTDGSAAIARAAGAEVVPAPAGKGRAIATALGRCENDRLVLLDADILYAEHNLARRLRDATASDPGAAMVVGQVTQRGKRTVISRHLYDPLVAALFPDAPRPVKPLSGFRVLDPARDHGPLPTGYGVETHLNLEVAARGGRIAFCELGEYRGPLRGYRHIPEMAAEIVAAILDAAQAHGRLPDRTPWQEWADEVLVAIAAAPEPGEPDEAYRRAIADASARPLPA